MTSGCFIEDVVVILFLTGIDCTGMYWYQIIGYIKTLIDCRGNSLVLQLLKSRERFSCSTTVLLE